MDCINEIQSPNSDARPYQRNEHKTGFSYIWFPFPSFLFLCIELESLGCGVFFSGRGLLSSTSTVHTKFSGSGSNYNYWVPMGN